MEDGPPDLFELLPEDVTQMIFSAICDCRTLVRCMAVSQTFYHHAVCVSSLSIVCPDNYSTYEEKLNKIYSMVKEFRELQTLVVRVGQPRDEPASWTRCMRYAEIGTSVEKFMFMAAKSGDFSELDNALASSEYSYDFENSNSQGSMIRTGNINTLGHTQNKLDTEFQNSTSYPGLMWSFFLQSLLRLRGFPRIGRLCDFSLRQVIAPSNDVMRRMLPVIHFAILQGLNEFRDVIPSFIANFPKLKRLLLVDISESVTIHLRQHNMDEIRSLHLQDVADWEANNFAVEHTIAENCTSQEMHAFGRSNEIDGEIVEVQDPDMKIPENSSVNNQEQPRSVQEEGISKRTGCSTARIEFNCDANSTGLHAVGMRKLSEEFDFQENLSSKMKLEKLRKGKELLRDFPEITEKGDCRKELGCVKSDSKNSADRMEIFKRSCGIYGEKDSISCIKLEDANSTYSQEDTERHFHMHLDKTNEITYSKTASPSCQYGVSNHDAEEPPCNSPQDVLDNVYAPISSSSGNGLIKFSKSSLNAECLHRPLEKSAENNCSYNEMENSGRWFCHCSCSMVEDNLFASEAAGCISSFEHAEECDSQRGNMQEEITANGSKNSLQCEERESREELYRCRSSRFQDIYHDGNMDCANRHPFKRDSERLSLRDSSRSHKIGIFRTVDDFAGNMRSMRKAAERLGESEATHTRKKQQFQTEDEFQLSPQMSISSSDQSWINHPVNSGASQKHHHHVFPECTWDQKPMDSSFQLNSLAKDSDKTGSDKLFSGDDIVGNSNYGRSSHGRHLIPEDSLLKERGCLEGNMKESSSISSKRPVFPLQANQDTSTDDRLIESPRQVWRGMRRERVRRLRDARRNSRTAEDASRGSDAQRVVRNEFQRRKNDLEKEALSFDYSFWRAEQVAAENYQLSDLSMCIATYSPKPLDVADIEILSYAALAGPLLAATVSLVNKQHSSHKL